MSQCIRIDHPRLHGTFTLEAGAWMAVTGPSGAGKSTLLRLLSGLDGATFFHPKEVALVTQTPYFFEHLTIQDNLSWCDATCLTDEILEGLGIDAWLSAYPSELSGGQRQRVAIARALGMNRPVWLLDEPLSALDENTKIQTIALLKKAWQKTKATVLFVSHQASEIQSLATHVLAIEQGNIKKQYTIQDWSNNQPQRYHGVVLSHLTNESQTQIKIENTILRIPMVDKKIGESITLNIV